MLKLSLSRVVALLLLLASPLVARAQQSSGYTVYKIAGPGSVDVNNAAITGTPNTTTAIRTDGTNIVFTGMSSNGSTNCSQNWNLYTAPINGGAIKPLVTPSTLFEPSAAGASNQQICNNPIITGSNVVYGASYLNKTGAQRYGFYSIPTSGGTSSVILGKGDPFPGTTTTALTVRNGATDTVVNPNSATPFTSVALSNNTFEFDANLASNGSLGRLQYSSTGTFLAEGTEATQTCANYSIAAVTPPLTTDGNGLYVGLVSILATGGTRSAIYSSTSPTTVTCANILYDPFATGAKLPGEPNVQGTFAVTAPIFGRPIAVTTQYNGTYIFFGASQIMADGTNFYGLYYLVPGGGIGYVASSRDGSIPGMPLSTSCNGSFVYPVLYNSIAANGNYVVFAATSGNSACGANSTVVGGYYVYNFNTGVITNLVPLNKILAPGDTPYGSVSTFTPVDGTLSANNHFIFLNINSFDSSSFVNSTTLYSVNVAQAVTAVNLTAPGTASTTGTITLSANVSPHTNGSGSTLVSASGSISFYDGSKLLGAQPIDSNGSGYLTVGSLTAGTHAYTATYSGDVNFQGATSPAAAVTVLNGSTTTTLTATSTTLNLGGSVTFNATLATSATGTPTGTITFMDGGGTLGVVTLSGKSASFSTTGLAPGSHSVTAVYQGDANFPSSSSAPIGLTVNFSATPGASTGYTFYHVADSTSKDSAGNVLTNLGHFGAAIQSNGSLVEFYNALLPTCDPAASLYTVPFFGGPISTLFTPTSKLEPSQPTGATTTLCGRPVLGGNSLFFGGSYTTASNSLRSGIFKLPITGGASADVLAVGDTIPGIPALGTASAVNYTGISVFSDSNADVFARFSNGSSYYGYALTGAGASAFPESSLVCNGYTYSALYQRGSLATDGTLIAATSTGIRSGSGSNTGFFLNSSLYSNCSTLAFSTRDSTGAYVRLPGAPLPTSANTTITNTSVSGLTALAVNNGVAYVALEQFYSDGSQYGGIFTLTAAGLTPLFTNSTGNVPGLLSGAPTCPGGSNPSPFFGYGVSAAGNYLVFDATQFVQNCTTLAASSLGGTYVYNLSTKTVQLAISYFNAPLVQGDAIPYAFYGTAPGTLTADGHYAFLVINTEDASGNPTKDTIYTVNLGQFSTNLTLSVPATSTYGNSVTLTASLSPYTSATSTAGGSFTFYDGTLAIGVASINSSGNAVFTTSSLGVGSHAITVVYSGDANYQAATSAISTINVAQATPGISLAPATGSTVRLNYATTLTATVSSSAATPTGSVTFMDGTTVFGTATLSNGVASISVTPATPGTRTFSAVYSGDSNFVSVTGSNTIYVSRAPFLNNTLNPAKPVYGQAVVDTLTTTTQPAPASPVSLYIDTAAPQTVNVGQAVTYTNLAAGLHSLYYTYPGDNVYYALGPVGQSFTVATAPLSIAPANATRVFGTPNPTFTGALTGLQYADPITPAYATTATTTSAVGSYLITASLADPSSKLSNYTVTNTPGTLTITQATPVITWTAPAAITYGTALSATQLNATSSVAGTFAYTPALGTVLAAGSSTLTAVFTPLDTTDYTSVTTTVQLTINKAVPTITFANPAAITYGTALTSAQLTATPSVPGTLTFTPAAGTVLTAGSQTLTVTFIPTDTADYTSTGTATATLVVNKAALSVTGASATRIYGAANPTFTGTLTGVQNADAITATYASTATTASAAGTYPITPTLADPNSRLANYTVTNTAGTLTITKAGSTLAVSAPASAGVGSTVTLTAIAASTTSGVPTGTVTFQAGTTTLGTATLSNGTATLQISTLALGTYAIGASYGGDSNFNSVNSTSTATIVIGTPDYTISVAPPSATITAGQSATFVFTITPSFGFSQPISFACGGLPANTTCTFTPSTVTPNGTPVTSTLIIATNVKSAALAFPVTPFSQHPGTAITLAGLLLLPLFGLRKRLNPRLCALLIALGTGTLLAAVTGCGSSNPSYNTPAGSYTVSVSASASGGSHAASLTVVVQ